MGCYGNSLQGWWTRWTVRPKNPNSRRTEDGRTEQRCSTPPSARRVVSFLMSRMSLKEEQM